MISNSNSGVNGAKWLLVGGAMVAVASTIYAAPSGEQVVRGNVQFSRDGAITRITASNGAIINYRSFNIGAGETVQFIQPNSRSRVLNRVLVNDPTTIAGNLLANGRVYIVNPAGVSIRNGAVVDVGGLYAAAGNISDNDFARGINRFTNLSGEVRNDGLIRGESIVLAGTGVVNAGEINAPGGMVAFTSGNDVYIAEQGKSVYVKVEAAQDGMAKSATGITNTGTVNAAGGSYTAMSGDLFAVALTQGGKTTASKVNIQGGNKTNAFVTGEIDASGAANGTATGGSVTVVANNVALMSGSSIDASGAQGGGLVNVGGGWQGQGTPINSQVTFMETGAKIDASATQNGEGGQVVVWADNYTGVGGEISARGAGEGSGGAIETSGKALLNVSDSAKVDASGPGGAGLWLLDPNTMNIVDAGDNNTTAAPTFEVNVDANSASVSVGTIAAALNAGTGTSVTVTTAAPTNANVALGNINWTALLTSINIAGADARTLTLNANNGINVTGIMTITGATDLLTVILNAGVDTDGTGFNSSNTTVISGDIDLNGASFQANGFDLQITPTGSIETTGGGNISLTFNGLMDIRGEVFAENGAIDFNGSVLTIGTPTIGITNNGTGSINFNVSSGSTALELGDALTIDAGANGTITFDGDIISTSGEFNSLTLTALNVLFDENTDIGTIGDDPVTDNRNLGNLTITVEPGGLITFVNALGTGQAINTRGTQTYNGDVRFEGGGEPTRFRSSGAPGVDSEIIVNGTMTSSGNDEHDVQFQAASTTINGDIGQGGNSFILGDLSFLDETGSASDAALVTINSTAWNVRTLNMGTDGLVSNGGLGLNITADNSTFQFNLDTDDNLTDLSFSGVGFNNNVDFQGSVGDAASGATNAGAFGSLRIAGQATLREGIFIVTTNAGGASGNQDYEGAVLIDDNILSFPNDFATINSTGGNVTFFSTVDDNNSSSGFVISAQNVEFQGLVGENNDVDGLTVTAVDNIVFSFTGSNTTGIRVGNDSSVANATFNATRIEFATGGVFEVQHANNGTITFNGLIADVGNGTDSLIATTNDGLVRFQQNVGTGANEALGRLVVNSNVRIDGDILTTDAGGFDGDMIFNGNTVFGNGSAGRTSRLAYIGSVQALGTDPDLAVDGFGDISFRGTINSFDNGINDLNQNVTVQSSGRREFQGSIGTGNRRTFLSSLTTGGDQSAGGDAVANPGQDILANNDAFTDAVTGSITIRTWADNGGVNVGNVDFWGPTFLDNDVTFDLQRDAGVFGTTDAVGQRTLTFRRTLDSFNNVDLRNLVVTDAFRVRFFGDGPGDPAAAGGVGTINRLLSADITVTEANGPADPAFIQMGHGSDANAPQTFQFLTNGTTAVDFVAQRFNGAVRLDADTTFDDDNNSDIIFESTVDSFNGTARDITVNTGGKTWFRGNVGLINVMDEITTDAAQELADDGTYLGFEDNGITVRSSNNQGAANGFGAAVANAAIDFNDRVFLDSDVTVETTNASGGINFFGLINTSATGSDTGLHGLTVNSSATAQFHGDIGTIRQLRRLVTDDPGFTRFGNNGTDITDAAGGALSGNGRIDIFTNGSTVDIGDVTSLNADTNIVESGRGSLGSLVRFRKNISSFDATFRALRITANGVDGFANPDPARVELWGNIGTGFLAGVTSDGSSTIPNDGVERSLRFLQVISGTAGSPGRLQLGNASDFVGGQQRPGAITIRTNGDPTAGAFNTTNAGLGNLAAPTATQIAQGAVGAVAVDLQADVELDANLTINAQANRGVRFHSRIDSLTDSLFGSARTGETQRSLDISNGSGVIAFDDDIGTRASDANNNSRLLSITTDTDAVTPANSGSIRLGNASGLNGAADTGIADAIVNGIQERTITIRTRGNAAGEGVNLGDQFINLDADVIIDAGSAGTVDFGRNAGNGRINTLDRAAFGGLQQPDIYRGLTVNTGGLTRFRNVVGGESFSPVGAGQRRLAFITTDAGTTGIGAGATQIDSDMFLQGREISNASITTVAGQQRRVALTLNDQTITIGDNTTAGIASTTNGVTIDSNITANNAVTGATIGGGALRFRGNIVTDGTSRVFNIRTNAQTLLRPTWLALTIPQRTSWVTNMLAPVAFGGDIGGSAATARFSTFTINQPGAGPFGLRGTGTDINFVPLVSTIFWADRLAWGTDAAWSLTDASVGPLNSAVNTPTFDVFTSGNLDFGQNEKGTAFGNLTLLSSAGQIIIGDLNAVGAKGKGSTSGRLIVGDPANTFASSNTQKRIMVRTRADGRVANFDNGTIKAFLDNGADFVANRINFRWNPARVAPDTNIDGKLSRQRIRFATPTGDHVTINGDTTPKFIVQFFRESLYTRQFIDEQSSSPEKIFLFDLHAKGISQARRTDAYAVEGWRSAPHETWPAGMQSPYLMMANRAEPDYSPVLLSKAEQKALADIGIMTRSQTAAQMLDDMIGRALFNDRPNATDANQATANQRAVSLARLNRKAASALAAEASRLLASNGGDLAKANQLIDQLGVTNAEAGQLKAALAARFGGAR